MATAPIPSTEARENLFASKATKQNEVKSFAPKIRAEEDQIKQATPSSAPTQTQKPAAPKPVVNSNGQVTGTIINTSA
ncbi:hypothetical protein H8K35_17885 [Undibacterium sp. LX40W]|uniref:Uncharacterized protein n=1 Tax=Undibacterium nitidum TaxID=2762298 RepID=A0A923HRJ5_9BURK|nr:MULTISPECIES: hypothetical protein [Undibacterium]MBC3883303.1 hypothetical protein [Undibacterium nitidum]MBC3893550.1 hypothetical protein [Undibacterium sp. LX40W]